MTNEPLLEVGRTGRAHGVRGELYLILLTDRLERAAPGARLKVGDRWCTVESSRPAGDRWLVHFEGVTDRTAAEALVNQIVSAKPVESSADGSEMWVHELIGSLVTDTSGRPCGTCVGVLANPAHDLLELDNGDLVPVVFIVRATVGVIVIDPPEGLLTT